MLIYKINNNINGKIYIGQTQRTLKERIKSYKEEYKFSKRKRPIIDAMRLYGFDNFSFEVIEDNISSKEELDNRERYYIQKYQSLCHQNGYNIELGGNSAGKHSPETIKKISESQTGPKNHMYGKRGKLNNTSKPTIELTTGMTFESASLAAEYFDVSFSHTCSVARGKRGSTQGYVFRYLDSNGKIIKPADCCKIKSPKVKASILPEYKDFI